jgi:hypothetical protein
MEVAQVQEMKRTALLKQIALLGTVLALAIAGCRANIGRNAGAGILADFLVT